jgi:hypothetical protein
MLKVQINQPQIQTKHDLLLYTHLKYSYAH